MAVINTNLAAAAVNASLQAHYGKLATSIQRLSSGLRVNSAADDAAGLAIRELMRADIAALNQGARNANDAISLLQVADAALGIIDEKLIRMKELAEQAATGTYDSTQRLMIDSEFQAMAAEIDRIANATDFNGIKLLDGSLSGEHDGSGLTSKGRMKIHFGSGNDSAEDYYYVDIGDCTVQGLGLFDVKISPGGSRHLSITDYDLYYGAYGSRNVIGSQQLDSPTLIKITPPNNWGTNFHMYHNLADIGITTDRRPSLDIVQWQVFAKDGTHLAGTLENDDGSIWQTVLAESGQASIQEWMDASGAFNADATYEVSDEFCKPEESMTNHRIQYEYTSGCNAIYFNADNQAQPAKDNCKDSNGVAINSPQDLVIVALVNPIPIEVDVPVPPVETAYFPDIKTQERAQGMIVRINDAIVKKDKIRAHLGALQNRLENTVANINIQSENLQASESRISDADIAKEMTAFVRNQVLSQAAVAMLGQANSLPQMVMSLLGG